MPLNFPYIIITSPKLCDLVTKLYGFKKPAMGFATFPNLIVFRTKDHPMYEQWLRHEKIHIQQGWESLGLSYLLGFAERMWAKYGLKMSNSEAYFYESIEQEAYANQHDPEYLKNRKAWAFIKYLNHKPVRGVDENRRVIINQ